MFDESFEEAFVARYGTAPEVPVPELARVLAHRSVRKFADRPVSEELVSALIAAAQSASTSSNLQLWSVVSVQDPGRRSEIAERCANQRQVRECAWFFAFLADHYRLREAARAVGEGANGLGTTEFLLMAVIDAALAAERMSVAAEALGLGVCYIGALRNDPQGVRELLDLPDGVFGTFGLCVGYPHAEAQAEIKPRLRQDAVWFRERYDRKVSAAEYDERMRVFYEQQGMKGDATWSMRSGRRADQTKLEGREILREWLESVGMGTD